jgi:hypothetical protein
MSSYPRNGFTTPLLLVLSLLLYAVPASADYSYETVSPPGADWSETFGINNAGKVTGSAGAGDVEYRFVYDMKKGTYTTTSDEIGVLEISNSGVMVGDVDGFCAMRDRKGIVTLFSPPSYAEGSFCQARGINSGGKVSGFQIDAERVWRGFIYDPAKGSYEEFLPSAQTIAHAINARGQNVGSVFLAEDEAYAGSPAGRYGYLREANGSVKHFAISELQAAPGTTRARGISESGLVAGFFVDATTGNMKSYVTTLSKGTGFEEISLTDDQVLFKSPCNAEAPAPGPDYTLYTSMTASQIRNDGVVVGTCFDIYENPSDVDDVVQVVSGFLATPAR